MLPKSITTILLILSVFSIAPGAWADADLSEALQPKTHSWFCAEADTEQKKKKQNKAEGEEEPDCE